MRVCTRLESLGRLGQYGIDQTGATLDRMGVLHLRSFSSQSAWGRILLVRVKA